MKYVYHIKFEGLATYKIDASSEKEASEKFEKWLLSGKEFIRSLDDDFEITDTEIECLEWNKKNESL